MTEWTKVRLGEVLEPVPTSRRESVEADRTYRLLGVRLNNDGPFLRETKKGTDSSATTLYRVKTGDLIYSRLFAWRGALGLIPPELDGCYVSNEFPLFTAREGRVDLEFLDYWFHLPDVIRRIEADCTGSTPLTRNRYKESFFLALEIPLPPLPEQRRIVTRVKGLLAKVEEARRLSDERDQLSRRMLHGVFSQLIENAPINILSEIAPLVRRAVKIQDDELYSELGVRSFGRGTFHKPSLNAVEVGDKKLFEIFKDDLIFSIVFAWEGAVAVARPEDSGRVGSHRFLTCVVDVNHANTNFLNFYFQTPAGLAALVEASPGGAGRNRTLSLKNLAALRVPIPALQQQNYFQQLLIKVDAVEEERRSVEAELDALPSAILARAFAGAL
jgi:type I restriction enzyme, S subunit